MPSPTSAHSSPRQRVIHVDDLVEPANETNPARRSPAVPVAASNPSARQFEQQKITASNSWESPIRIRKKIGPQAPISGKSYRQKPPDFPHQPAASAYFTVD